MALARITGRLPVSLKRRVPALSERDDLRRKVSDLRERVAELEARLDYERLFPAEWANRRVRDYLGNTVTGGPFKGMRYPDRGFTDVDLFAPKLLGIYERELEPAVERLIAASPRTVVAVGAAEGWYAVGLAMRLPHANVLAYDLNAERLELLREVAALNGVAERVETHAERCDHRALRRVLARGDAVVCDCDGCEAEVLDPAAVPKLRDVHLLIEAHDLLVPGTTQRLERAFSATHSIARVDAVTRFIDDFPQTDFMPWVTRHLAISEFRGGPMWWLEMTPKHGPATRAG